MSAEVWLDLYDKVKVVQTGEEGYVAITLNHPNRPYRKTRYMMAGLVKSLDRMDSSDYLEGKSFQRTSVCGFHDHFMFWELEKIEDGTNERIRAAVRALPVRKPRLLGRGNRDRRRA